MSFKRAEWHSGLTYRQSCETCNTTVEYQDDKLDFRPWYPDGFIYCPNCKSPLRHDENYAVNRPAAPEASAAPVFAEAPAEPVKTMPADNGAAFCSQCGKAFKTGDRFCTGCGSKREEETEAPVAAPVFAPAEPVAEPAAPIFAPAEPIAEPAAPEFCVPYAASAPIVAPKKYALKEKMPIAAIVLMGIAVLFSLLKFFGNLRYMSVMGFFMHLMTFGGCGLMFAGMLLHRKKGQLLTGIGALSIMLVEIISIVTAFGYYYGVVDVVLEILFIGAYTVAGLYYLLKKPVLGMPIKLIVFCVQLTVYLIIMARNIGSFRYLRVAFIFNILWNIFSAVALIIYTPFKKAKA